MRRRRARHRVHHDRLSLAVLAGAAAAARAQSLPGPWQRVGAITAFEEMRFSVEDGHRLFISSLHDRPEISGATGSARNCALGVADSDVPAMSFEFVVVPSPPGRLVLREPGAAGASRCRRVTDTP
jgi:hypothetical protein